jgi:hypothetical protein
MPEFKMSVFFGLVMKAKVVLKRPKIQFPTLAPSVEIHSKAGLQVKDSVNLWILPTAQ